MISGSARQNREKNEALKRAQHNKTKNIVGKLKTGNLHMDNILVDLLTLKGLSFNQNQGNLQAQEVKVG